MFLVNQLLMHGNVKHAREERLSLRTLCSMLVLKGCRICRGLVILISIK
jgi:hypothetical protein